MEPIFCSLHGEHEKPKLGLKTLRKQQSGLKRLTPMEPLLSIAGELN
jgi:hypothetical protein